MTRSVAVLGGGIGGLAAAHYLSQLRCCSRVVVVEATHRLGGWVSSTTHHDQVVFEHGPRTLRLVHPKALLLSVVLLEKWLFYW